MAARPLLIGLRNLTRAPPLSLRLAPRILTSSGAPSARLFHNTTSFLATQTTSLPTTPGGTLSSSSPPPPGTVPSPAAVDPNEDTKHAAFLGEADSDDAFNASHIINPPQHEALDGTNSAFLGEADSDDGYEAHSHINPKPQEALDGTNSAFLGEADSNDGYEADSHINPKPQEALDASQSAFLGEGDSDDGFEGERLKNPIGSDHNVEDPGLSGFHGETGEHDQHV